MKVFNLLFGAVAILFAVAMAAVDAHPATDDKVHAPIPKDTINNGKPGANMPPVAQNGAQHDHTAGAPEGQEVNGFDDMQNRISNMGDGQGRKSSIFPAGSRLQTDQDPNNPL
ncbi:hypothetical protein BDF22DRAFT_742580 [Syncephalis plumigaleata]|nr:hypothetical protein BDF22DRAFT_742580 [Syncephalis plumigaleata]